MSTEALKQVIGRAIEDAEFRELLFGDVEQALKDYDLIEEELNMLKSIQRENFDAVSTQLTERISRVGLDTITHGEESEAKLPGQHKWGKITLK